MAEDYVLTDPIVVPGTSTEKYKVVAVNLMMEFVTTPANGPGLIIINLRDNLGNLSEYKYVGQQAIDFMKFMNTANFSTTSMQKRILQKLSNDGLIPPGTVTGAPDAVARDQH